VLPAGAVKQERQSEVRAVLDTSDSIAETPVNSSLLESCVNDVQETRDEVSSSLPELENPGACDGAADAEQEVTCNTAEPPPTASSVTLADDGCGSPSDCVTASGSAVTYGEAHTAAVSDVTLQPVSSQAEVTVAHSEDSNSTAPTAPVATCADQLSNTTPIVPAAKVPMIMTRMSSAKTRQQNCRGNTCWPVSVISGHARGEDVQQGSVVTASATPRTSFFLWNTSGSSVVGSYKCAIGDEQ
jgi:hypothetical protein